MSEQTFFTKGRNRGNDREVKLQTATLLVGKEPTKAKRIRTKFLMVLSGKKTAGMPDWLAQAYEFVAKSHDTVTPEVQLSGFDVTFSADHLFGDRVVLAPKCQLRGFEITEIGDSENPDVALLFSLYAPFSDKLWRWCGQMGGEEFWARFEQVDDAEQEEEEEEEPEGDSEDEEEPEERDSRQPALIM